MRFLKLVPLLFLLPFPGRTQTLPSGKDADIRPPLRVIFETDLGNDIDDALALDMLYKYADRGEVRILGIVSNKEDVWTARFIGLTNRWYGYPHIPVGMVEKSPVRNKPAPAYTQQVCEMTVNGRPAFGYKTGKAKRIPEATRLYRKLLAAQPDTSVVIVSVGFSTNLARLLDTQADRYSPLTGQELVARKVRLLSVMAGDFRARPKKGFNVVNDIPSAQKVFTRWPSPLVMLPYEAGLAVRYPASSIENDFGWTEHHPLVEAYKRYSRMPYDRPSWDLLSVLYAVEPDGGWFTLSPAGRLTVGDDSHIRFIPESTGRHRYLTIPPERTEPVRNRLTELVTRPPRRFLQPETAR